MIQLTDYLYSGDTVLRILQRYSNDLRENANESGNDLDSIRLNRCWSIMNS